MSALELDGVVPLLARSAYDQVKRAHWSTLKAFVDKSPAHFRWAEDHPGDFDTDAMRLGRAFHVELLEPHLFDKVFKVTNLGGRTNAFKELRADALLAGLEVLHQDEADTAKRMADSARALAPARELLEAPGTSEASLFWTHRLEDLGEMPGYEIECKARVDRLIAGGPMLELKSTKSAGPGFGAEAARYCYHGQSAFYLRGLSKAERKPTRECLVLAVENLEPFVPSLYRMPDAALARGWQLASDALDRLNVCTRTGAWPGYWNQVVDLELPRWAFPADELVSMEVIEHAS